MRKFVQSVAVLVTGGGRYFVIFTMLQLMLMITAGIIGAGM